MKFCEKCGAQLGANARFCPSCGQSTVGAAYPATGAAGPTSAPTATSRHRPRTALGRLFKVGCFGIIVLGVVGAIGVAMQGAGTKGSAVATPGGTAPPAAVASPDRGTIGDTRRNGNWEITLDAATDGPKLGDATAQGVFLVTKLTLHNLGQQTANLTSGDFSAVSASGRTFTPSSAGSTAALGTDPPVLWLLQEVQPGLSMQVRVIFDVDPATSPYTLHAAGTVFGMRLHSAP